jgi:glucosylceramidase
MREMEMPNDESRRSFLKKSGLAVAVTAASRAIAEPSVPVSTIDSPQGELAVWITDGERRLVQAASLPWRASSAGTGENAVVLEPGKKFQEILGFGGAFTDAACYVFNQLSAEDRQKVFHQLFHPSEMALNVCRTCVGASDYSTKLYCYDDGDPDPELTRFSIEHDRQYILPMLREARKVNPDLFLFSSPWSPPGWMKANGSMLGGSMRRQYMASYANYFLKFLQGYEAEGVPVQAVTVQNEVDTDQDGRMPACVWPQEYEVDFVRHFLGPLFQQKAVKTRIWLVDHNYNLWGRAICELETPQVRQYANAVAWHGYVGEVDWISRVCEAYPDCEMYWTEGGPDYTEPKYGSNWSEWGKTFAGILRNWCRSITAWNLALDEKGRPNIGPFSCGGTVTIHSQTHEITYSGQFWALAHYSRFVRRGARRFDSQGKDKDLAHVAFENPDGQHVLVLSNSGEKRVCQVRMGNSLAEVPLTRDSMATLVWR